MKMSLLLSLCMILSSWAYGQHTFRAELRDHDSGEPLVGATALVEGTSLGASTGDDGLLAIEGIPAGEQTIIFRYVGYEEQRKRYTFPLSAPGPVQVEMHGGEELETVYVTATRSSRTIEDIPTRIEVLSAEELGEKAVMNSTNIAMLLRESTGIMMQQTSPNSANQSLRIQGLDGRYTQLLKDGFPLFGGFGGGLSIMQIPPLDLQQVEVIKGSASTLYGGGAIAGIVNLVTKRPEEGKPELTLMLNQTTAGGTTANAFASGRKGKTGYTLFASGYNQEAYDPNEDDFSDIPEVQSLSLNPKFFWYPDERSELWLGINTTFEDRLGGDLQVIDGQRDSLNTFSERNQSKRFSTQLSASRELTGGATLSFRNSISYFDRDIEIPAEHFGGRQIASYSELTWKRQNLIIGANLFTDDFSERNLLPGEQARDYDYQTAGFFAQHEQELGKVLSLETGLRADYNTDYGLFVLPRLSLLIKAGERFSSRIGGGMGYTLPTIFTEAAETRTFRFIAPIDTDVIEAERSIGANVDFNYKTLIGDRVTFSINQLFFYTRLRNSLLLDPDMIGFANASGPVSSKGMESNVKFGLGDFKLFLQYALTDVDLGYLNPSRQKPLTPRHSAGAVFMFEQHDKWRIGYELYYTGEQYRSDGSQTPDYFIMGLMVLRSFEQLSVFINFENFTDTRQSRYQSMVTPPFSDPTFTEVWAPTDGFVANAGFIYRPFK